jgi:hypothetical protein
VTFDAVDVARAYVVQRRVPTPLSAPPADRSARKREAADYHRDWPKSQDSPRRARNGPLVSPTVRRSPAAELTSARAQGPSAKIGAYAGMDLAV